MRKHSNIIFRRFISSTATRLPARLLSPASRPRRSTSVQWSVENPFRCIIGLTGPQCFEHPQTHTVPSANASKAYQPLHPSNLSDMSSAADQSTPSRAGRSTAGKTRCTAVNQLHGEVNAAKYVVVWFCHLESNVYTSKEYTHCYSCGHLRCPFCRESRVRVTGD